MSILDLLALKLLLFISTLKLPSPFIAAPWYANEFENVQLLIVILFKIELNTLIAPPNYKAALF